MQDTVTEEAEFTEFTAAIKPLEPLAPLEPVELLAFAEGCAVGSGTGANFTDFVVRVGFARERNRGLE